MEYDLNGNEFSFGTEYCFSCVIVIRKKKKIIINKLKWHLHDVSE